MFLHLVLLLKLPETSNSQSQSLKKSTFWYKFLCNLSCNLVTSIYIEEDSYLAFSLLTKASLKQMIQMPIIFIIEIIRYSLLYLTHLFRRHHHEFLQKFRFILPCHTRKGYIETFNLRGYKVQSCTKTLLTLKFCYCLISCTKSIH